ncbi:MAG: hypothetical protein ACRDKT_04360 [Actinomycetota bacterium]
MRGRVGPDPGQREESFFHLVIGDLGRRRRPEVFEIDQSIRYRSGQLFEVRAAVSRARRFLVEGLRSRGHHVRAGERAAVGAALRRGGRWFAEMLDERRDHPLGRRPRAIRRADRLDDLFEDRGAPDHPPRTAAYPREVRIGPTAVVQRREILVQSQDVCDLRQDLVGRRLRRSAAQDLDPGVALPALADDDRSGLSPAEGERHLERPSGFVDEHRWEARDAVGDEGPPQIDRLTSRTGEAESQGLTHGGTSLQNLDVGRAGFSTFPS